MDEQVIVDALINSGKSISAALKIANQMIKIKKQIDTINEENEKILNPPKKMFICAKGKCRRNI